MKTPCFLLLQTSLGQSAGREIAVFTKVESAMTRMFRLAVQYAADRNLCADVHERYCVVGSVCFRIREVSFEG